MSKYVDLNGLLYFKEKIDGLLQKKLDKNQGSLNSGKYLRVSADGNIITEELNIDNGVTDYNALTGKPQINGHELNGNQTSEQLGLQPKGNYADKSEIPTKTSQLTNDSGFLTKHQSLANLATKDELNLKADKTAIPTKVSQLQNDKNYLTEHQDISGKLDKNLGKQYNGQMLVINASGDIIPETKPTIVTNYNSLTNKPQINGHELSGNKGLSDLGITPSGIGALPSSTKIPKDTKDLTNGADFQTGSQVESKITGKGYQTASQVQTTVNNAVKGITSFEFSKVSALPPSGQKGIIYLVPNKSSEDKNVSDEYIWDGTAFELLGTTQVDLSGYYNSKNFLPLTNEEIDTVFA